MRINNNIMAMNAHRQLGVNNAGMGKSLEKLSSGFRVNRAGDDAAGLSISEKMRAQIRGLDMASKNAQDGISLIQTAEGALDEVHAILQRMRELAVQSSTDTNVEEDREYLQAEINQLLEEIDKIADRTEFNTQALLDGTFGAQSTVDADGDPITEGDSKYFHVGANQGQNIEVSIAAMDTEGLGIKDLEIDDQSSADAAITTLDTALDMVSKQRSDLGAIQNRLEHTIKNLDNASENLQAAESRIRDVDMAKEMMEFTKQSILQQASTAMLAQANMAPQSVLQLLG